MSDEELEETPSNWEFIDRVPTRDEVLALLESLDPVFGVETAEFVDYVQGLPSTKKIKKPREGGRGKVEEYHDVVTLYMGVAGRLKMIQKAAELHGWRVDFEPEPNALPPGMLQMDERIVYREYCVITDLDGRVLGRKPGMAWVPAKGGQQAAGSNPYEKVETAARGRAIAAWGFGVLPGSGIASLEEMLGASRQSTTDEAPEPQQAVTRDEMLDQIRTDSERIRQIRQLDSPEQLARVADYVQKTFGMVIAEEDTDEEGQPLVIGLDWSKLNDGQLLLVGNQLRQSLRKLADGSV